ncbi:DNA polymerase-3 subunit gamma/tau [Candidatus Kryptonium thompsonii]|uniref:DNA polymerase III subunit gamma/tau n=2 Tax=Candidatus Kryptonium thompsonii TaxID=1633631 RepID=A0A0N7MRD4_9BACT|nr:DNA polymerase III subunit gamma/tau [Candidatus Kryptonium thompsoni]CUS78866.1 DNA polymerase-3 subunit gamma/tau [Candidatus Kryptonium thompsoni]CUS79292.1 DNA polymerase-3 subunit gamma/tau [Candidatus Kryptonium thompsoni]CUS82199.1 DNA polymerase-3 subunit gamma/tau [Candidatus Kryptonium thompsoni]CUS83011.1 DNA polymerase-3 subunit gamma/tau [Candidatus Kryptonium thompsoni]CUS84331.1 DNA polymerase-3 subunit gamma/tau [Candidatus Kryptonium thompsoni]
MAYLVTARKWRPSKFSEVVGQEHVTATLLNSLKLGRVAHAYIFAGPRGIGKTTVARILAKAINCLNPQDYEPCNECEMCVEISNGRSIDVLEIDGASNRGIDEVRDLRESVRYTPTKAKYKVYIIDEVHMLTKEAFNALLKTLEEPPPHILFIFATTEPHRVPSTILSRCQRFDFRRIEIQKIIERLKLIAQQDKIQIDDDSLFTIAKKANGSLRDALSIFDQVVSFCGEKIKFEDVIKALNIIDQEIFFRVTDIVKEKNIKAGLELVDEITKLGYDFQEFLTGLSEHLRNFLVVITTKSTELIEATEYYKSRYISQANNFTESDIIRMLKIVNDAEASIKWAPQPRLKLEMVITQLASLDSAVKIQELLAKIEELEKYLNSSGGANPENFNIPPEGGNKSKVEMSPTSQNIQPKPSQKTETLTLQSDDIDSINKLFDEPTQTYEKKIFQKRETPKIIDPEKILNLIREKWDEIVNKAQSYNLNLTTALKFSWPIAIKESKLNIGTSTDLHLEWIKKNRSFLREKIKELCNLDLEIDVKIAEVEQLNEKIKQLSPDLKLKKLIDDSPFVKSLIEILDAKPID